MGGPGTEQEQGCRTGPPGYIGWGGTDPLESILGLLISLKIQALALDWNFRIIHGD
jgi:hypothetical protein